MVLSQVQTITKNNFILIKTCSTNLVAPWFNNRLESGLTNPRLQVDLEGIKILIVCRCQLVTVICHI